MSAFAEYKCISAQGMKETIVGVALSTCKTEAPRDFIMNSLLVVSIRPARKGVW